MEAKNYETRHIFLAIGICIAVVAPILLIFIPQTVAEIFHYKKGVWEVLISSENFIAFGCGFALLFIACMVLFVIDIKKSSVIISTILIFFCLCSFALASQTYTSLGKNEISYSSFFSLKNYTYSWEQVDEIVRINDKVEDKIMYEFVFSDGERTTIEKNDYFIPISNLFSNKIREQGIPVKIVER